MPPVRSNLMILLYPLAGADTLSPQTLPGFSRAGHAQRASNGHRGKPENGP